MLSVIFCMNFDLALVSLDSCKRIPFPQRGHLAILISTAEAIIAKQTLCLPLAISFRGRAVGEARESFNSSSWSFSFFFLFDCTCSC